jgi:MoaA/NifB/PqqE/SkfB family radical SAM enzyme
MSASPSPITLPRLGLAVTWRCNLACAHCLQSGHDATDLDLGLLERLLPSAQATGLRVVGLTGGEATLHPEFDRLVALIARQGLAYTLTTNGTLLTPLLEACSILPPVSTTLSFDGPDAASHDAVRGPGAFDETARTAQVLAIAGVPFQMQATLTSALLPQLPAMARLAEALGAGRLMLALPIPSAEMVGRGLFPTHHALLAARRWAAEPHPLPVQLSLGGELVRGAGARPGLCSYLRGAEAFVDVRGRLTACCQTAGVGDNSAEVVADLRREPWALALGRLAEVWRGLAATGPAGNPPRRLDHYRCLLCLEALGKLPAPEVGAVAWRDWWSPADDDLCEPKGSACHTEGRA